MQLISAKPHAEFVVMTQALVDNLLSMNNKNRHLRDRVVTTYKRAIDKGLWVPTNQGIGVSATGFLVDGQHRLEALRAAGYPAIKMLLVTGLPDDSMAAVDGGVNRTPRDYLQFMFDTKISALVSAILRTSMLMRDNAFNTKYQPQEYAEHLELLGNSISAVMALEHAWKTPGPVMAAIVDAHHKGYEEAAISFHKALSTGEMLERDNPALILRNWLNNNKGQSGTNSTIERYRRTVRALQAWIDKKPLGKLYHKKVKLAPAKRNGASAAH